MAKRDEIFLANLAFLLNYDEGQTNDEIEYEIFKVAFQDEETIHYDRQMGGNFRDLEQESGNIATIMKLGSLSASESFVLGDTMSSWLSDLIDAILAITQPVDVAHAITTTTLTNASDFTKLQSELSTLLSDKIKGE